MKKLSLLLSLMFFAVGFALAQRSISGTVSDEAGEPLIGASILVKGTSTGTVSDVDGSYSLTVPADANTLVVSYTGFNTLEVELGASNLYNLVMSEGVALDEVVVTGLGIRREKKALGYAVTTIGSKDIELRPEADVARVLRGKVAGVDINQTSGMAGSGTNVVIRGYSSISGTNQPLFVVDGVPFNSDTNNDRGTGDGGATASSRFLDLDPNSIADVSVLKGLSATVLYGEAGRNGVILITTKNGDAGSINRKLEVTVDQSFFANNIASVPDDQDRYGNGFHNVASAAFSNWGAPFDEPGRNNLAADGTIRHPYDRAALNDVLPQYKGARYDYRAYDNLQNFFQTGLTANTSLNIASRLGNGSSINFSYGYRDEEGFIPGNTFNKHNFGLGTSTKLQNGLRVNSTFNFVTSERTSPPTGVSTSSNPVTADGISLLSNVFYVPRSVSIFDLEYENPVDRSSIFYRGGNDITHPLWTLNNVFDDETVRRFFGNVKLDYDLTNWLSVGYRVGVDAYSQQQRFQVNKGGRQVQEGLMNTSDRLNFITDHLLNFTYNFSLSENFSLDGNVGANLRRDTRTTTRSNSRTQFVYGLFQHSNFTDHNNTSFYSEENLIGAFATATLGYRNYLYLNLQARNDWTSTLEPDNRSILYPSASVSFVPTDAFAGLQNNRTVNFLKLRFGYGTSAGYPDPYRTRDILAVDTRAFITRAGQTVGISTIGRNDQDGDDLGNLALAPELHEELEFGVEGRFFNNRFGLDLSVYNKESTDIIIGLNLDPSTGYSRTTVNSAALTNKGIEIAADLTPVSTRNFTWTLNANFTANEPLVNSIAEGIDQIPFETNVFSSLGNFAIPGEPFGVIVGDRTLRDANGNPIVTASGLYQLDPDIGILGDPNPDYVFNYGTTLRFKSLSFNVLFTYQEGGDIYATTPSTLMSRGILQESDFDRFIPVIAPGVLPDGTPNNIQITSTDHFWQNGGVFISDLRVYDGTYVKLREASLSYTVPKKVIENTPFGNVSLTFSGQNLWFRAFGFPKGANFDPEVLSTGVSNARGFEYMNVPTARQIGGSLRITF